MARSGGKQFVMVFEQFFKRLVVQVDKLFQLLKCMSYFFKKKVKKKGSG